MRASALGVWVAASGGGSGAASGAELARLAAEVAWADATLSHPNRVCVEAATLYVLAVAYLIRNPGDGLGALMAVETELQERCTSDVVDWFYQSVSMHPATDIWTHAGHVKHAFRLAFYHLRRRSTAEEALRDVLRRGGDADTNACIVGGLIGALHGYTLIPEHLKKRVLMFDCAKPVGLNHRRPHTYSVARCFPLVQHMAPLQEPVLPPSRSVHVLKMDGGRDEPKKKDAGVGSLDDVGVVPRRASYVCEFPLETFKEWMPKILERAEACWSDTVLPKDMSPKWDWMLESQIRHLNEILYVEKLRRNPFGKNLE
jgi:hypothetical protein